MFKMFEKAKKSQGFTLIELMIVVAIIGILAAVAIPGYVGFQNKSRRGSMERSAKAASVELATWILCAREGVLHPLTKGTLVEVDTNYDGQMDSALGDIDNAALGATVISDTYATARSTDSALRLAEMSPFEGIGSCGVGTPLYESLGVAVGSRLICRITLADQQDTNSLINTIEMTVADADTNLIGFWHVNSAD